VPIRQWVFKSRCEGFIEGLKGSRPTRVNERRLAWGSGRQDIQRRTGRHHLHARPRRHLGDRRRPLQSSASPPRLKADSGEGYRLRLHAGEHRCVSRWQHGAIGQHKFGRGDNVAVTLFNDMARRPQPLKPLVDPRSRIHSRVARINFSRSGWTPCVERSVPAFP
jgi:hypothetical protein